VQRYQAKNEVRLPRHQRQTETDGLGLGGEKLENDCVDLNRRLLTSKAPLESLALVTSLITSAESARVAFE